jgi:hypothetical protein
MTSSAHIQHWKTHPHTELGKWQSSTCKLYFITDLVFKVIQCWCCYYSWIIHHAEVGSAVDASEEHTIFYQVMLTASFQILCSLSVFSPSYTWYYTDHDTDRVIK